MNILIDPNAEVKVEFWTALVGGSFKFWTSKEAAQTELGASGDVTYIQVAFCEPNYRDVCELADMATTMNSDGSFSIGLNNIKMERVCRLIKSWNIKDKDGKDLPCTRENVHKMNPTIAFHMAILLEKALGYDQEADSQ